MAARRRASAERAGRPLLDLPKRTVRLTPRHRRSRHNGAAGAAMLDGEKRGRAGHWGSKRGREGGAEHLLEEKPAAVVGCKSRRRTSRDQSDQRRIRRRERCCGCELAAVFLRGGRSVCGLLGLLWIGGVGLFLRKEGYTVSSWRRFRLLRFRFFSRDCASNLPCSVEICAGWFIPFRV